MRAVNTHAIIAIAIDGRRMELGRLGSLERAVALGRRIADELGDEFVRVEYVELDRDRELLEILGATYRRDVDERRELARRVS